MDSAFSCPDTEALYLDNPSLILSVQRVRALKAQKDCRTLIAQHRQSLHYPCPMILIAFPALISSLANNPTLAMEGCSVVKLAYDKRSFGKFSACLIENCNLCLATKDIKFLTITANNLNHSSN